MSSKKVDISHFSPDTQEFLNLLYKHKVEYVIVGAEAVIYYGHVRLTGDVDIYYSNSDENIKKLYNTLLDFWDGKIPELENAEELQKPGLLLQYGVPPNRIDLINTLDEILFTDTWQSREVVDMRIGEANIQINYISLDLLIKSKEIAHRPKDLDDLRFLKAALELQRINKTKEKRQKKTNNS
jgi:hypothetical protein